MVGDTLKNLGNRLVTDAPIPSNSHSNSRSGNEVIGDSSSSPSASFSSSPSKAPHVASVRSLDGQMSEMGPDDLDTFLNSKGGSGRS